MRVLILGGTVFLGRHLVDALRNRGHEVVLFNRGTSSPKLFPDIEQIHGDRTTDLSRIGDRTFDAVIDTCAYLPGGVQKSADFLRNRTSHYTFISTIAVYDLSYANPNEDGLKLRLPEDADPTVFEYQNYGALKVLCEDAALKRFGEDHTLIVRPGFIVGPYDPTDRFSYWPYRFSYGGKVAAPPGPDIPTQFIDARDLAEWTVGMLEREEKGAFNLTSPPGGFSVGEVFSRCRTAAANYDPPVGPAGDIIWMDDTFLESQNIQGWSDMPLWMAKSLKMPGVATANVSRAQAKGLKIRPLDATVQDTLAWILTQRGDHPWKAGLSREREAELIRAFLSQV